MIDVDEWNRRALARREERAQREANRRAGKALAHARKLARNRLANQAELPIDPSPNG